MDKITAIQQKLLNYSHKSEYLLYEQPELIKSTINDLKADLTHYAKSHTHEVTDYCDKSTLKNWQNNSVKYFTNYTSGTTGKPFSYRIWKDIFLNIEKESHYGLINREFKLPNRAKVLYLCHNLPEASTNLIDSRKSDNVMLTHGYMHTVDIALKHHLFYTDIHEYIKQIHKICLETSYDIIMATKEILDPLWWLIEKKKIEPKRLAPLLSCTGNFTPVDLIRQYLDAGIFDNACDHMRCWDGGASFFTCKEGTRHLCDNLSHCQVTRDYKLLSDDYFSLPNPFINYWNGDHAQLIDRYEKCKCGRYFRPFRMFLTEDAGIGWFLNEFPDKSIIKRILSNGRYLRVVIIKPLANETFKRLVKAAYPRHLDIVVEEP